MKKFILLYKGPATPPDASHEGWPDWFGKIGESLVSVGSPMMDGFVVHPTGSTSQTATGLNGFSIVQAETRDDVISLVKDHPFLSLGTGEYSIEVFEVPKL